MTYTSSQGGAGFSEVQSNHQTGLQDATLSTSPAQKDRGEEPQLISGQRQLPLFGGSPCTRQAAVGTPAARFAK